VRRCKCGGVGAARTASLQIGPRRQPEDGSDGGRIIRTVSTATYSMRARSPWWLGGRPSGSVPTTSKASRAPGSTAWPASTTCGGDEKKHRRPGASCCRSSGKAVASACGGVEGGGGGDASEKWPQSWALIQSTHRSAEEALPMRVRRHRTVPPAA